MQLRGGFSSQAGTPHAGVQIGMPVCLIQNFHFTCGFDVGFLDIFRQARILLKIFFGGQKKSFHIFGVDRRISLHPGWHVGNYSKSLGRCVPHGLLQGTDLWVTGAERLRFARFLMKYGGRGYNSWSFLLDQL